MLDALDSIPGSNAQWPGQYISPGLLEKGDIMRPDIRSNPMR